MQHQLTNKTILITGASRGIGRALAYGLGSAGATTILCGRRVADLESIADEIEQAGGPQPVLLPINLEAAAFDDYLNIAEHVKTQFGGLDGLILNAARLGELSPISHSDPTLWAQVFQLNVHSAYLLLHTCQQLVREVQGHIIFTLAEEALKARANWGAYAASKYALRGLMDVCVAENSRADSACVSALLPPPSRTALRLSAYPGVNPATLAEPDSIVPRCVEVLCDTSRRFHGLIRGLDGTISN